MDDASLCTICKHRRDKHSTVVGCLECPCKVTRIEKVEQC